MPDAHKNFAVSTVATAPSPASSGTSLVVASGHGTRFPAVPFNATVWPAASQPDPSNAEIVRVTAVSTDTLTISRAQEGSSARTVVVGDQFAATVTAKTLTDAETGAWTAVVKASDESVTSNTTHQADDELLFTAVSGAVYEYQGTIIYVSPVGAGTPDIKLTFGEDATNRGQTYLTGVQTGDAATNNVGLMNNQSNSNAWGSAATDRTVTFFGSHTGAGGTFVIKWAQNTSDANALTVKAGSILRYRRIV